MRFVGQAFEVGVEIPAERLGSLDAAYLAELFADAHHRTFMHGATLDRPVEIVTLRVGADPADRRRAAARPRDAGSARAREDQDLPRRGLDRLRPLYRRGADRRPEDRRPGRDRGLHRHHLGAARLDSRARRGGQSDPAEIVMSATSGSHRLCRDQPGADRLGARDGREADPLGLLDHPARGARRLGRPDGPPRQHGGAGRAASPCSSARSARRCAPASSAIRSRR